MTPGWPVSDYLVNDAYRFVCCPIPKAASSSIKQWFLTTLGYEPGTGNWPTRPHVFLSVWNSRRSSSIPNDYYQFAFVRDPRRRLVSAFLQKFVVRWNLPESPSRPVVRAVSQTIGRAVDYARGITFRDFVHFVSNCEPIALDVHWRPQCLFLSNMEPDFVGRVESFDVDMDSIAERLGIPRREPFRSLQLQYSPIKIDGAADMTAGQLRRLPAFPAWESFFDDELARITESVYADDFNRFGYPVASANAVFMEPATTC